LKRVRRDDESLELSFLPPLSNFQHETRAIGAAIGRDVRVMGKMLIRIECDALVRRHEARSRAENASKAT